MTTLQQFFRNTPPALLQIYFTKRKIEFAEHIVWQQCSPRLVSDLVSKADGLDEEHRTRLLDDTDRIGAMSDEGGQAAIISVADDKELLGDLENGYARAIWLFIHDPRVFEYAEQVRYADDRRFSRMWAAFSGQPGRTVARDPEALTAFGHDVRHQLGSPNVKIEVCDRLRVSLTDDEPASIQISVFREGRSESQLAFVDGQLDRHPNRPVIEAALSYEPERGTIEVVAADRASRETLVRLLSKHLLGLPSAGERLKLRQYELDRLRRPFDFPTEAQDNIDSVCVTRLRLMPLETQAERVTLECLRGTRRSIWDMAANCFGAMNPLKGQYRVTQAHLVVRFKPVLGVKGPRSLPVTISLPHGCDLRDRTQREQMIGRKYLRIWNLVRDV